MPAIVISHYLNDDEYKVYKKNKPKYNDLTRETLTNEIKKEVDRNVKNNSSRN